MRRGELRINAFYGFFFFPKVFQVDTTMGLDQHHFKHLKHGATLIIKLVFIGIKQ
jgi:hypothetical protein